MTGRLSQNLRVPCCARSFAGQKELVLTSFATRSQARRKAQLSSFAQENRHSATESERILWSAIRRGALGVQFRRQVPIAGLFIGDFVASKIRLQNPARRRSRW